jgi:hypothetical protein
VTKRERREFAARIEHLEQQVSTLHEELDDQNAEDCILELLSNAGHSLLAAFASMNGDE